MTPNTVQTVGQLTSAFLTALARDASIGLRAGNTLRYYRAYLDGFAEAVGPGLPLSQVHPYHLEKFKTSWASVQAVKRMFAWAVEAGLMAASPVAGVKQPLPGQRRRVLTRAETVRLLRAARPPFRYVLLAILHAIARPQEVRALRWSHLNPEGTALYLTEIKDNQRHGAGLRVIPVDGRLRRLLDRLRRRRTGRTLFDLDADSFIFLNSHGAPWTSSAVVMSMIHARNRCGLRAAFGEESVCCFTLRNSGAAQALAGLPFRPSA